MGQDHFQEDKQPHEEAVEITSYPKAATQILAAPLLANVFGDSVIFAKILEDGVDHGTWRNEPRSI